MKDFDKKAIDKMKLFSLLPYEKYIITSDLNIDEVTARLETGIQPKRSPFSFRNLYEKQFEGEIYGNSFKISRAISYRNSFLPIIKGEIHSNSTRQTDILITSRPAIVALIFMSFWLGVVGIVCLGILCAAIINFSEIIKHGFSAAVLIPFGMFAFGCALTVGGFKIESKKARELLQAMLDGTIHY